MAADGQRDKAVVTRLGRRRRDRASRYGDLALSALLASLIDIEPGGEPEPQRSRFARAAVTLETHIAAARDSAAGDGTEASIRSARAVFTQVGRLLPH